MPLIRLLPDNATLDDLAAISGGLRNYILPYMEMLMSGRSPLAPGERQLIAAYVSGINGCQYCYVGHSSRARELGIDDAVLTTLLHDLDQAPIEPRLKPILRYVRKLTETPSRMAKADADAVYQAGWTDEALFHAIAVCAMFNCVNRIVDGAGLVRTRE